MKIDYEPRHKKTCLGTDHLIFWGAGVGGGRLGFFSRFSSDRKAEIFFSQSESKNFFFSGQSKNFFSKQPICSK